jgi:alpha-beta hydrolase superfamily lysophospholipase
MDHATQTPFTTHDGHNLAVFDWPLWASQRPRATVLVVHGLGEHAWRYNALAIELNEWGFAVRAYDQRGHGDSSGKPGCLPQNDTLLHDLADVLDDTRTTHCRQGEVPLILLGHSMGGLVAALHVAHQQATHHTAPVDALVLSSPAFDPGLGTLQRALLALLPPVLPDITVSNGLDPRLISHDPDVVRDYVGDPRVHNRISPRLGRFIADGGPRVLQQAAQWAVPTLLMYAGADGLVNPEGSRRFAAAAPAEVVQARCFEDMYHELFNEANRFEVLSHLRGWLNERF